ncbi:MAG: TonB-dependent receptor [Pseudomonadota bacterium]
MTQFRQGAQIGFAALFISLCAGLNSHAQAQTAKSSDATVSTAQNDVYERAFFDRFVPQTAFDLLSRVPGFTIVSGADLRGFGGGAGNVLIDGDRPTVKSGGLEEVLRRIPANAVARIEISRGAQRAGETAGQSVVANVIRTEKGIAGTWSVELERNAEGLIYPRGDISVTAPLGGWETTTRLNAFWEQFVFTDFDRKRFDANGDLLLFEKEDAPSTLRQVYLSTEAKRPLAGGTLTFNGRFGNSRFYRETGRDGFFGRQLDGNPNRRTDIRFDSEFLWDGELSADWTRTFSNDWSVKVLGLGSGRNVKESSTNTLEEPLGVLDSVSRFETKRFPLELISRGTFGRVSGTFKPEFGVEAAYNRLDSEIALEIEDASGVTRIDLPASDVTVEEARGEAFANLTWIARPKWTVEAGMAIETSEITVTGDAGAESRFTFLKPSAALVHQFSDEVQFRAAVRRTVGQLDFNNFAASANAEDDRFLGGNPDLGPDQTTRASFTADLRSGSGAALNIEPFYEWREDVLEQVILPSGAFGVANAGAAEVWGIEAEASLPLGFIIPGGLIEADVTLRDSSFDDPLTGQTRNITGLRNPEIDIDFRQDLTDLKFAWGISYEAPEDITFFFVDEIDTGSPGATWTGFIETTRFFGVKMQLEARNIGGIDLPRERRFFNPDRSGAFSGSEFQDRARGAFVKLTISDQF